MKILSRQLFRCLIVILCFGATLAWCLSTPPQLAEGSIGVRKNLPLTLGPYLSHAEEVSDVEKKLLPADTEVIKRTYTVQGQPGLDTSCGIVLGGKDPRSVHKAEVCLTGQGWAINQREVISVELADGTRLEVLDLHISRPYTHPSTQKSGVLGAHYMYWFVGHNVSTPSHTKRMMISLWDNLRYNVNHRWAYVHVLGYITDGIEENGSSPEATRQRLKEFIRDIVPFIQPGKTASSPSSIAAAGEDGGLAQ